MEADSSTYFIFLSLACPDSIFIREGDRCEQAVISITLESPDSDMIDAELHKTELDQAIADGDLQRALMEVNADTNIQVYSGEELPFSYAPTQSFTPTITPSQVPTASTTPSQTPTISATPSSSRQPSSSLYPSGSPTTSNKPSQSLAPTIMPTSFNETETLPPTMMNDTYPDFNMTFEPINSTTDFSAEDWEDMNIYMNVTAPIFPDEDGNWTSLEEPTSKAIESTVNVPSTAEKGGDNTPTKDEGSSAASEEESSEGRRYLLRSRKLSGEEN